MAQELDFNVECQALGLACAKAKFRLDEKAPTQFNVAYRSFRGQKTVPDYFERKWLSLRLSAIKRGMVLAHEVDAAFLERITPAFCPVTLQRFDLRSKSTGNPSIDRLVNEGTYAAGNVCVLSIRANQAKGAKTFEEVAAIAAGGEPCHGLDALEWMRLASLMYGAWSVAVRKADPYLLPLATFPGPNVFTSESQVVQLMLLRHCSNENWPGSLNVWKQVTATSNGSVDQFMLFANSLHEAIQLEDFAPTAWLYPGVFDGFVSWYNDCKPAINHLMASLRGKHQSGVEPEAIVENWKVENRYLV